VLSNKVDELTRGIVDGLTDAAPVVVMGAWPGVPLARPLCGFAGGRRAGYATG
jgi:hypothetical protein